MFKVFQIFLSVALVVIVGLIVAPWFIDTEAYKPQIQKIFVDATGLEIDIEDIEVSGFPWVGITLNEMQLKNSETMPLPYRFSIKSVEVQLEILPLINDKYEINRFNLKQPELWLESDVNPEEIQPLTDDPYSIETAAVADAPQEVTVPQFKLNLPETLLANLIKIDDGAVYLKDRTKGELSINDINLKIHNLQKHQPFDLKASAELLEGNLQIEGKVGPIESLNDLEFSKLPTRINLEASDLILANLKKWINSASEATEPSSETTENAESEKPAEATAEELLSTQLMQARLSLQSSIERHADQNVLSTGSFTIDTSNQLSGTWKAGSRSKGAMHIEELKMDLNNTHILSVSGNIKHLYDTPRYELRMESPKLQRLWLNQFVPGLQAFYQNHPSPWKEAKAGALIAGDKDILDVRDFQLQIDNEPLQVSGNFALGGALDAQLRMTANQLHLDSWIPNDLLSISEEPNLSHIKPWYVSLQLNAKSIELNHTVLNNVRMSLSAENGVVRLNPLSFNIDEGHISEDFTLYANQFPVGWKENMHATQVALHPLLKTLANFDQFSGIAQLSTNLSGKGLTEFNIKKLLNGSGQILVEDGQIQGLDIIKAINGEHDSTTPLSTSFSQLQGSFQINRGTLENNDLYMVSPLFRLTGQGNIQLLPLHFDYTVRPRQLESLSGQSSGQLGVVTPLQITGSFHKFDVSSKSDTEFNPMSSNTADNYKESESAPVFDDSGFDDEPMNQNQEPSNESNNDGLEL